MNKTIKRGNERNLITNCSNSFVYLSLLIFDMVLKRRRLRRRQTRALSPCPLCLWINSFIYLHYFFGFNHRRLRRWNTRAFTPLYL